MRQADELFLEGVAAPSAGTLIRALNDQYGIAAEGVERLATSAGGVWIALQPAQGRRIVTPAALAVGTTDGVLRRAADLADVPPAWVLRLEGESTFTVGELTRALHASGIRGEDLGTIRRLRSGQLELELPRWRYRERDLPDTVLGCSIVIERGSEKKNSDGQAEHAETATAALRAVVELKPAPHLIAGAAGRALRLAGDDPDLRQAVVALRARGYSAEGAEHVTGPGLMALTHALARPRTLDKAQSAVRQVAFPTDEDRQWHAVLDAIIKERRGPADGAHPASKVASEHGWQTLVAGTLCPGLRAGGDFIESAPTPDGVDLWSLWLGVAAALATRQGVDPAELRTLDTRVRADATRRDLPLLAWPALYELLEAEAVATAAPIVAPLRSLEPGTAQWERAALASIDEAIGHGNWDRAQQLVSQAASAWPPSIPLARRRARLGKPTDAELAHSDGVVAVTAATRALARGRLREAEASLLTARPEPGTPAAAHAAHLLLGLGHPARAWALLAPSDSAALRLEAAVAAGRWDDAVDAWSEAEGDALGLHPTPWWAEPAVMSALDGGRTALLQGRLTDAADELDGTPAGAACAKALAETPTMPTGWEAGDPLVRVLESPDPLWPLRGLVVPLAEEGGWLRWGGLVHRLAEEVPADSWPADLLDALRESAADAEMDTDLPASAEDDGAGDHSLSARLETAQYLLAGGRNEEAAQVALSLGRKAQQGPLLRGAVRVLLETGREDAVDTALTAERSAVFLHAVLSEVAAGQVTPQLAGWAQRLAGSGVVERVRLLAARVGELA